MVYKFTSVYGIVEKLYRDYEHQEELDIWDIIEWSGEALEFIGAGQQYDVRVAELTIVNGMSVLPCNFHSQPQPAYNGRPMSLATGSFAPLSVNPNNLNQTNVINGVPVSTSNFPTTGNNNTKSGETYYIRDGVFVTSVLSGTVILEYRAIKTDENGYPMIPDIQSYRTAITKYCQMMLDERDARKGRISKDWAGKTASDWQWYCGQARGVANMPNLSYTESIKNQWVKLKPNQNAAQSFYNDATIREQLKNK